ncbi:peptidase M48 [Leptospira perolatii]|uniref:Peptidase M48 n=1 Tax=Leptospira perolatii TaxID=2023191 RepID=A0A2M9ZKK5_9LEPT|nr:M48 family metallopeptidase [Leptospira perolatii]PJZ69997.1 peptidase M48 [Leptospira perolatii]PJZ72595.1 peptidase M48 [Leptospira perolatii]
MELKQKIWLILLLLSGAGLSFLVVRYEVQVEKPATLAPIFQLLGKPVKTMDRAFTKILPVNDMDEKELGDAIADRYSSYTNDSSRDYLYVQSIVSGLTVDNKKGFSYRAFILEDPHPNAFAMPGGIIFVTTGLLNLLQSEAELAAVIGHEIGHIELSHCMDGVRFELLTRKIGSATLGEIADIAVGLLLRPSFSKNQEAESDEYGYQILQRELYDLSAMGTTFQRLKEASDSQGTQSTPLEEYFMTHPYLEHRSEKYANQAKVDFKMSEIYYVGRRNLKERINRWEEDFPEEHLKGK